MVYLPSYNSLLVIAVSPKIAVLLDIPKNPQLNNKNAYFFSITI
jgi:hypothetical protein